MNGEVIYAKEGIKPTGESPLHTHIFKKRPDIIIKSIIARTNT